MNMSLNTNCNGKGTTWRRRFGGGDLALSCFGAELFWS